MRRILSGKWKMTASNTLFMIFAAVSIAGCMEFETQEIGQKTSTNPKHVLSYAVKNNLWEPSDSFDRHDCNRHGQRQDYWQPLVAASSVTEMKRIYSKLGIDPSKVTTSGGVAFYLKQMIETGAGYVPKTSDQLNVANCAWNLGR